MDARPTLRVGTLVLGRTTARPRFGRAPSAEEGGSVVTVTILAFVDGVEHAEEVVHALKDADLAGEDLSIVMHDWSKQGEPGMSRGKLITEDSVAGAIAGALPGLLGTFVSLFVPGLGFVRAFGPIVAALGAAEGTLVGAAIGVISASEIPEERSRLFEKRLKQGHVLLAVHTNEDDAPRVERIFAEHGAREVFRTV
jgi:hypothetical protein